MTQPETVLIRKPFVDYLTYVKGCHVEKTHGSQFQEGFPDLYVMSPKFTARWVETKRLVKGDFSFTPAQLRKFPIWIANGVPIWIVYGEDFRGNKVALERAYQSLFNPANCGYLLDPVSRRMILR